MNKYAFLVASAVVCASMSVVADDIVQGGNVFGILAVESKSADTIVAIPWCECSASENQSIAISNIVKTANLTKGDTLSAFDEGRNKINTWELAEGEGGVLYWRSVKEVTAEGVGDTISATQAHAVRGSAIILHRKNPTNGDAANPFYLYGQVGTNETVTTTLASSEGTSPAYTLIAPPSAAEQTDVAAALSNAVDGDSIVVRGANLGGNTTYTYKAGDNSGWYYYAQPWDKDPTKAESIFIKRGLGAWYVSRSTTVPTLEWTGVPTK